MPIHQISQEQRKKRLSPAQHNGAFPLLPVCENGFQTSLVSIPFGLADCCSNHSIDFNVNNKISALVSILVLILVLLLVQAWSKVFDLFARCASQKTHARIARYLCATIVFSCGREFFDLWNV